MGVASPNLMTAAFQTAYNARDTVALIKLYAPDAVHTFDGNTISKGHSAIGAAFGSGFAGPFRLAGETISCVVSGDIALLRVRWKSFNADGTSRGVSVSCEVAGKGADGLWRYVIDDATGGFRDG